MSAVDELASALVTVRRQLRRGQLDSAWLAAARASYDIERIRAELEEAKAEIESLNRKLKDKKGKHPK